jgi:CSLREA domain-containing protein
MKSENHNNILLSRTARMILLLVMSIACTSIASAATYTVTKTADTNGTCSFGNCSLREAIAAANSTPDNDTINFNIPTSDSGCSGGVCTITLNSSFGQLTINSASTSGTLTITNVGGAQRIEISGNDATRVFQVNTGANLTINNVTVRDGSAPDGGGIFNGGTLEMTNCTVSGNSASDDGGGIFNGGTLTMTNCTVSGNSADYGGGIRNEGTLTMTNCTVSGNSADGGGGGIFNYDGATLTMTNCTVSGNIADDDGGGIANGGTLEMTNCTVSGNRAIGDSGNGGGIFNGGTLEMTNCTVSGNIALAIDGGGIFNGGTLTMTNCTVSGNSAFSGGGGIFNGGTLTMTSCTVSGNSGGGIFNGGTLTMTNCTVSGNSGGGIYNNDTLTMTNCTVAGNSVSNLGGGIYNVYGTVNARNTIIANNSATVGGPDFYGTLTSLGYNLIRNTSGMSGTVSTDITGVDPYLTPLGYYGGPTQTRALMRFYLVGPVWSKSLYADNPAINSGDNCVKIPNCSTFNPAFAITTDQRGARRNLVEIGAYEISNFAASLPNATVSQSYEFTISQYSATEGNFTYSMSGLPTGLSLTQSVSSGVVTVKITGTPGQSGNFTPILTIRDSTGRFERVVYTLNVASGMGVKVSDKEF